MMIVCNHLDDQAMSKLLMKSTHHKKIPVAHKSFRFSSILHELSVGWFTFLQFSEAARDVRPVREELLPPKPIKAARKRCALLQEAQRIDCVQNTTLAHPSSPDIL